MCPTDTAGSLPFYYNQVGDMLGGVVDVWSVGLLDKGYECFGSENAIYATKATRDQKEGELKNPKDWLKEG